MEIDNDCEICGSQASGFFDTKCETCPFKYLCKRCRDAHDKIVRSHATLCRIAIENTVGDNFAGVLCRTCGREAKCEHF